MKLKYIVASALVIAVIAVTGIFAAALVTRENNTASNQNAVQSDTTTEIVQEDLPKDQTAYTLEQVAEHASKEDCWIIISDKVYDVTEFIAKHPGGAEVLANQCGKESTQAFQTQGGEGSHSGDARGMLAGLQVGIITKESSGTTSASEATQSSPAVQQPAQTSLPASIAQKYPNATIKEDKTLDTGERKLTITDAGVCREITVNSQDTISKDEVCESVD